MIDNATSVLTHRPVSAIFNADKYLPFGYTQGTAYLSLTLTATATGVIFNNDAVGADNWSLDNFELHVPVLRPGNEFAQNFRTLLASGMPINIHSVGFQNSQQNIAQNTTGAAILTYSTRKRSVKSLLTIFRINSQITNNLCDSVSCRKNLGISTYQYSVGGVRIPSAPISCAPSDSSTVMAGNDLGALAVNTSLALGHYDSNLRGVTANRQFFMATTDTTLSSRCAFALDLESYGEGLSGKNLSGQGLPLVLHCQIGAGKAPTIGAILADLYIIHDVIFQLDGISGTLTASS